MRENAEAILAGAVADVAEDDDGIKTLFKLRTANEWLEDARRRPAPKMLFGEFWYEGEICILFADTNVGKSILAVQIADAISRGIGIQGVGLGSAAQTVIYFDFELSDKQFEARYSEKAFNSDSFTNHFHFDQNLIRAEIDPEADIDHGFRDFEHYLQYSLEKEIVRTGGKVLIIDNLTYLKNETERAKDALPLMKYLKAVKNRYGLSILALAHTPKRDYSKPITRNDLQGSKMLINFCDSSFAIGESCKENDLRYLKQIKVRNAALHFDAENVLLCTVQKPENFLHFEITGYGSERDHLRNVSSSGREELIAEVKTHAATGKSQRQIAGEFGISLGSVNKYLRS